MILDKIVDSLQLLKSQHFSSDKVWFELKPFQQAHGELR